MKEKLLEAIDEGRARETELVALVVDEPADPEGPWHAKDHLAHLSWWRWRSANTLDAVRTGGEPPAPVDDDDAVTNAIVMYTEIKDRPRGWHQGGCERLMGGAAQRGRRIVRRRPLETAS